MVGKGNLPETASFAARLAYYRQKLGFTQAELARRARDSLTSGRALDRASISRYEAGSNIPRREVLEALAKVLAVSLDDLLPGHLSPSVARHLKPVVDVRVSLALDGETEMARLVINDLLLPYDVATKILGIINEYNKSAAAPQLDPVEKKDS